MLGINKILAIYVGPTGYAALGQFQNAVQMISTVASGGINAGVTKYTAEFSDNEKLQHKVWRTANIITLIGGIITSLAIIILNKKISEWIFKEEKYANIVMLYGSTLIFCAYNSFLMAIINGKKEINYYIIINVFSSIISAIMSGVLIIQLGIYGAILALCINQSISLAITILVCHRATWFNIKYLVGKMEREIFLKITKYIAMALTSAITVPMIHMMIRNHLVDKIGWEAAGYWEAIWRLSANYMSFATAILGIYFLPRLSELKNYKAIKKEIIDGYRIIMPISILMSLGVYVNRDLIIDKLFTSEFYPMRDLFGWQMLGDTLKIVAWIIGYVVLAKAMVLIYITTEIVFGISFYVLAITMSNQLGLKAVAVAHAVNYLIYCIAVGWLVRKKIKYQTIID